MNLTKIILLIVIALFTVGFGVSLSKSSSTYTDFADAKTLNKEVHIIGEWVNRGQEPPYDASQDLFRFFMQDSLDKVELVHFYDPKPMNMENAEKVAIVGKYQGDKFVASQIVTKCPSKYEPTDLSSTEGTSL